MVHQGDRTTNWWGGLFLCSFTFIFSAKARSAAFCGLPDQYSQRRKDREKCQGEPIASSVGPTVVSTVHVCVKLHAGPRALAHN